MSTEPGDFLNDVESFMKKNSAGLHFISTVVRFLRRLEKNNTRDWFKEHQAEYENLVLKPAQEFVFLIGKELEEFVPNIIADPKINRSIFRLNRDTRFRNDKAPYKTNLGIFF